MAFAPLSLKARALRLLALREHSRAELQSKLARHVQEGDDLPALLDQLHAIGAKSVLITSIPVDGQHCVVGYNHVTGELVLAPPRGIRITSAGMTPIDGYQLLAQIYSNKETKS